MRVAGAAPARAGHGAAPRSASIVPVGGRVHFAHVEEADVLVVGAGAAGLTAALGCVPRRVVVLTKTQLSPTGAGGASVWAQGGVASAVGEDDDPALHAADTLAAGAGLNDAHIVSLLTGEGPQRIRALLAMGAEFDRDAGGHLALGREAAHSRRRILHAHGDATGAEVVRTLVAAVHREPAIRVVDRTFAVDLWIEDGRVAGVTALRPDGCLALYRAAAVVLATGGAGQLFRYTTNPREATADGLAMAARAGAVLVDLEFVQFHPTALAPGVPMAPSAPTVSATAPAGPAPAPQATAGSPGADRPLALLTEALRGEGAVLVDDQGTRFMIGEHPDRELAPRDVVARAIWRQQQGGRRVFLDARQSVGERFPQRFPTVFALCQGQGIDPRREAMPVVPAAHYHMGGVAVDESGRTSLPGLWACGEVAATGAHGANRLASNSLLEALVFGARVAEDAGGVLAMAAAEPTADVAATQEGGWVPSPAANAVVAAVAEMTRRIRRRMWELVGVERTGDGLKLAVATMRRAARRQEGHWQAGAAGALGQEAGELRNLAWVAALVAQAALARRESRGGHYRADYPCPDVAWQRRLFLTAGSGAAAHWLEGYPATTPAPRAPRAPLAPISRAAGDPPGQRPAGFRSAKPRS